MTDRRTFLRIREGAFTYLLAVNQAVSIERRNRGGFQMVEGGSSAAVAWYHSGGGRIPIVRLGVVLECRVAEWEYAILLSDGSGRTGVAAEHVYLIPESDVPVIQPFNPVGTRVPVVTGVCLHTDPEYLVLDLPRLQSCLRRASGLSQA